MRHHMRRTTLKCASTWLPTFPPPLPYHESAGSVPNPSRMPASTCSRALALLAVLCAAASMAHASGVAAVANRRLLQTTPDAVTCRAVFVSQNPKDYSMPTILTFAFTLSIKKILPDFYEAQAALSNSTVDIE